MKVNSNCETPFIYSCSKSDIETIKIFLEYKKIFTENQIYDGIGFSILYKKFDNFFYLLSQNLFNPTSIMSSSLIILCLMQNEKYLDKLLEFNANIKNNYDYLKYSFQSKNSKNFIKILINSDIKTISKLLKYLIIENKSCIKNEENLNILLKQIYTFNENELKILYEDCINYFKNIDNKKNTQNLNTNYLLVLKSINKKQLYFNIKNITKKKNNTFLKKINKI